MFVFIIQELFCAMCHLIMSLKLIDLMAIECYLFILFYYFYIAYCESTTRDLSPLQ